MKKTTLNKAKKIFLKRTKLLDKLLEDLGSQEINDSVSEIKKTVKSSKFSILIELRNNSTAKEIKKFFKKEYSVLLEEVENKNVLAVYSINEEEANNIKTNFLSILTEYNYALLTDLKDNENWIELYQTMENCGMKEFISLREVIVDNEDRAINYLNLRNNSFLEELNEIKTKSYRVNNIDLIKSLSDYYSKVLNIKNIIDFEKMLVDFITTMNKSDLSYMGNNTELDKNINLIKNMEIIILKDKYSVDTILENQKVYNLLNEEKEKDYEILNKLISDFSKKYYKWNKHLKVKENQDKVYFEGTGSIIAREINIKDKYILPKDMIASILLYLYEIYQYKANGIVNTLIYYFGRFIMYKPFYENIISIKEVIKIAKSKNFTN